MKKALWTLAVDNYPEEILRRSFPLLERYAEKIGADFCVITSRKWPAYPACLEKFQVFERGQGYEWNIFLDADAMVDPDLFDLTEYVPKDTVMHYGADLASNRFTYDRFFRRDGRNIGSGSWLVVASDWCHEIWEPAVDLSPKELAARIAPLRCESAAGLPGDHFVDDFVFSRNIAKYGLKFTSYQKILEGLMLQSGGHNGGSTPLPVGARPGLLWHQCLISREQKIKDMDLLLKSWGLDHASGVQTSGKVAQPHSADLGEGERVRAPGADTAGADSAGTGVCSRVEDAYRTAA